MQYSRGEPSRGFLNTWGPKRDFKGQLWRRDVRRNRKEKAFPSREKCKGESIQDEELSFVSSCKNAIVIYICAVRGHGEVVQAVSGQEHTPQPQFRFRSWRCQRWVLGKWLDLCRSQAPSAACWGWNSPFTGFL